MSIISWQRQKTTSFCRWKSGDPQMSVDILQNCAHLDCLGGPKMHATLYGHNAEREIKSFDQTQRVRQRAISELAALLTTAEKEQSHGVVGIEVSVTNGVPQFIRKKCETTIK